MAASIKITNFPIQSQNEYLTVLKAAMIHAGFSVPIERIDGTNVFLTYELDLNLPVEQDYAPIALEIKIEANLYASQRILSNWVADTASFTSASTYSDREQINKSDTIICSCNHPELQLVTIHSAAEVKSIFGIFKPANRPAWWDEITFPYLFIPKDHDFAVFLGFDGGLSPFANDDYICASYSDMQYANPQTGKVDLLAGILLFDNSNQGIAGSSSQELCRVCSSDLKPGNLLVETLGNQFYLLKSGTSGFAIKSNWPEEY